MAWKEQTVMSQRLAFMEAARAPHVNFSELCRQYGISRKTGYKWLRRVQPEGSGAWEDRSHRPRHSPQQTDAALEAQILAVRQAQPDWGGRKIRRWLQDHGVAGVPAASTVTEILRRHHLLDAELAAQHRPWQRFERERPNQLWQMDFKGYFALGAGGSCHPLTVLDDHSRFLVGLQACANETFETVQAQLRGLFEHYGLPDQMLMDNGAPWGCALDMPHTILTAWLLRLDIGVSHGRPYHPQTQGKDERLHRTLQRELLRHHIWGTLPECQQRFDQWRATYNQERPHEALHLATPASCYQPSLRPFPVILPPIEYAPGDLVRKVDVLGKISFANRRIRVGKAFRHQEVGLRPLAADGEYAVYFCKQLIAQIDLREIPQC